MLQKNRFILIQPYFQNPLKLFFFACATIFFVARVYMVAAPILFLSEPVRADDAYTYIVKGAEFQTCFLQDCPALESLRPQLLRDANDADLNKALSRNYLSAFVVYQPLYNFLLSILNLFGISWAMSTKLLSATGIVIICWAVMRWVKAMWGEGPAGIALLLLAFHTFPHRGLSIIFANNLTLGIALLVWTAILTNEKRAHVWTMVGVPLMMLMHSIGFAYAAVTLLLYSLVNWPPIQKKHASVVLLSAFVLALGFWVTETIHSPEFSLRQEVFFPDGESREVVEDNISATLQLVGIFANSLEGVFPTSILIAVGIYSVSEKRRFFTMGCALLVFSLVSILFPVQIGNFLFQRVWVSVGIFLIASIGGAIWFSFEQLFAILREALGKTEGFHSISATMQSLFQTRVILTVLLSMLIARSLFDFVRKDIRNYRFNLDANIHQKSVELDNSQPIRLLFQIDDQDTVLYMNRLSMNFYLSNGTLDYPAIFIVGKEENREFEASMIAASPPAYLVTTNTTHQLASIQNSSIVFAEGDKIAVRLLEGKALPEFAMRIENPGKEEALLQINFGELDEFVNVRVAAGFSDWLVVGDHIISEAGRETEIEFTTDRALLLKGIRVEETSTLNWPWDKGIELLYSKSGDEDTEPSRVRFSTKDLVEGFDLQVRVLADGGSTVLAEVIDRKE